MNPITEFLNSGIMPLCINMIILTILLIAVLSWISYRRARRTSNTPPPPNIFSRMWTGLINWLTETPADKEPPPQQSELSMPPPVETIVPQTLATEQPTLEMLESEKEEEVMETEAGKPEEVPAEADTDIRTPVAPVDAVEVLRVWRDLADGSLIIDFDNRRYRDLGQLSPDLHRRFIGVLRSLTDMAKTLGPGRPQQPPVQPAPPPAPPPAPARQTDSDEPEQPHMLVQLGRVMVGKRSSSTAPSEPQTLSIAEQIDEVLQKKIQDSDFAEREIQIRPSVTGGVTIKVDDAHYESVDDIEDTAIREFIQSAIQEWEAGQ